MKQLNPVSLLESMNASKSRSNFSLCSEVESKSNHTPVASAARLNESEFRDPEPSDDLESEEKERYEVKDEIETILSSEGKTDRKQSISEEISVNKSKIHLEQAYRILEENSVLHALIKSFSSSN